MQQSTISGIEYLVFLEKEDVTICQKDGVCIFSSDANKIGEKPIDFNLEKDSKTFVRLDPSTKTALVVGKEEISSQKDLLLYKKIAEIILRQFIQSRRVSDDSVDRFLTGLINTRESADKLKLFELQAKSLGIDPAQKRVAILIDFPEFSAKLESDNLGSDVTEIIQKYKREINSTIKGFFTKSSDLITGYVGDGRFVVFKTLQPGDEGNFRKYMKTAFSNIFSPIIDVRNGPVFVSFGGAYSSIQGIRESYKEASLALNLAKKLNRNHNQSFTFDEFGEYRILVEDDGEKKLIYAQEVIGDLNDEEIFKTLETFFDESLNVTNTAARLNVHPNTVLYRLKKIKNILGLDPRVFEEAVTLKMSMLVLKIFG